MINLYISTTGNDGNDGLSPLMPFLTAQHACDVAYASYYESDLTFNFASGSYSGIVIADVFPSNFFIKGAGSSTTYLGGISCGDNYYNITIHSDASITLGSVDSGLNVGLFNNIQIYNGVFQHGDNVSANGKDAPADNLDGYSAGSINLYNCSGVVHIYANGGNAVVAETSVANGGNGGGILLYNCYGLRYVHENHGGAGSPPGVNGTNGSFYDNVKKHQLGITASLSSSYTYNITSPLGDPFAVSITASLASPYKVNIGSQIALT